MKNKQEIVDALKTIKHLKKQVSDILSQRAIEEANIRSQFQVDVCNKQRDDSAKKHADLIAPIQMQITALQTQIEDSIDVV